MASNVEHIIGAKASKERVTVEVNPILDVDSTAPNNVEVNSISSDVIVNVVTQSAGTTATSTPKLIVSEPAKEKSLESEIPLDEDFQAKIIEVAGNV